MVMAPRHGVAERRGDQGVAGTGRGGVVLPPPRLTLFLPDAGWFGHVCVCEMRDKQLTVSNGGQCQLTITSITSSSPEFIVPDVDTLPIRIAPDTTTQIPL